MRILKDALVGLLLLSQIACGTLLYPERQGQTSGRMDPSVLILNGIGLFFFVVPGLVSFAVDFSTGAIYLPADSSVSTNPLQQPDKWQLSQDITVESINRVIREQRSVINVLGHENLVIQQIDPADLNTILNGNTPVLVAQRGD